MNDTLKRYTTLLGSCLVVSGEEFFSSLFFLKIFPGFILKVLLPHLVLTAAGGDTPTALEFQGREFRDPGSAPTS